MSFSSSTSFGSSESPVSPELTTSGAVLLKLNAALPRQYDIVVRSGLIDDIGRECNPVLPTGTRILVITDNNLAGRYLETIMESLQQAGFTPFSHVIPAGEHSKSIEQALAIYEKAMASGMGRSDAFLALGGGVVGDLAGFCAFTYHRGVGFIQVPTTLLSQVDSAIGGKTGINAGAVKNGVGTFYQPLRVLADPTVLQSLPERERAAGLAEVLKYGLIETSCDEQVGFWSDLLQRISEKGVDAGLDETIIRRCAAIKASVVMKDELETLGLRFFLNLGHTFGHAYESLSDFGFLHGEAVAIGMLKAVQLAVMLNDFPAEEETRLRQVLHQLNLDEALIKARDYNASELLAKMRQDKKNHHDQIRLVLPSNRPGLVRVRTDVQDSDILTVLSMP